MNTPSLQSVIESLGDDLYRVATHARGPQGSLPTFEFRDVRRIGADIRITLTPKKLQ